MTVDAQVQADFQQLGIIVEQPETEDQDQDQDAMPIAAENWTSVMMFMACETQWRVVASMAGLIWIGLDYTAVKVLLDTEGLGHEVFRDLRTMEAAALPILNEAD